MAALMDQLATLDPRDQVLLGQNPTLMMPRFGHLPDLNIGQRRYVIAHDGLYVQAKTSVISLTSKIADTPLMPYGELSASIEFVGGLVPANLAEQFLKLAQQSCPLEAAAFVIWDKQHGKYALLHREGKTVSSGHITYFIGDIDRDSIACSWHSHGEMDAYFSRTDDASDIDGLYIASVFGQCAAGQTPKIVSRIVVDGLHLPIPWNPW